MVGLPKAFGVDLNNIPILLFISALYFTSFSALFTSYSLYSQWFTMVEAIDRCTLVTKSMVFSEHGF